jgi:uncharacterized protein (TIGR02145 family)
MNPSQIGKYKLLRLIGEGGMASVYEAEHETLGSKAAIKVLNPLLSSNKQIRERFKNEARLMASLEHPNITRVLDYEESDSYLAIAMELLPGEDLSARIRRQGKLSEAEIVRTFEQVLQGFEYAHSKGVVHRDIKPSNIFLLPNGQVKILDFGIAKLFDNGGEMTQTGTQMGTPVYMSPEQVNAEKNIDHRSDIYSLGVTLFYALSGKAPYDSTTSSQFAIFKKIVEEPLPSLEGPNWLVAMVHKACQKDRNYRYASCSAWAMALRQRHTDAETTVITDTDKTVIEPTPKQPEIREPEPTSKVAPTVPPKKRGAGLYIGIGLGVLLLVGLAFWLGSRKTNVVDAKKEEGKEAAPTVGEEANPEVTIGQQVWMTKNLDVSTFRNGDPIPQAKTDEEWEAAGENQQPAWCYYNNDPQNEEIYGKLYNWYAVNDKRGLAPEGYHVPTDAEWTQLSDYLGGEDVAGKKMKSTSGWFENGNGTNESGFNGLPGGVRYNNGTFRYQGDDGYWWSASEFNADVAYNRLLDRSSDDLGRNDGNKGGGFSVRCLRD